MPHYSIHVEHVYNVEADTAEEAQALFDKDPNPVADTKFVYVTDENGEEA